MMQEEDAGLGERRRQSAAGLRGAEQALTPVMVSHVVDALFDRCGWCQEVTLVCQMCCMPVVNLDWVQVQRNSHLTTGTGHAAWQGADVRQLARPVAQSVLVYAPCKIV